MSDAVKYDGTYFADGIFDTDYDLLAQAIAESYRPQTVIDVGCGPGKLSASLARFGTTVTAIDGYSEPEFGDSTVEFTRVNLNDGGALLQFIDKRRFDVAICVEVAEHLNPCVSSALIDALTAAAPVVVFSSAVPSQGGHGHINLRPRNFWHQLFCEKGFLCADRIRPLLRDNATIAPWYRFNVLDYVRADHPSAPRAEEVVSRLIAAESDSTSALFRTSEELRHVQVQLKQVPVNWALSCRRLLKRVLRRQTLD